jgi:hypothetical protein
MVVQWLGGEFSLFGIHFQNWMAAAAGIVVLNILYYLCVQRRQ